MKLKLTDEEIKVFVDISDKINQIQNEFGILQINQVNLEKQLTSVEERRSNLIQLYNGVLNQQKEHTQSLIDKYGQGNLNTETWEIETIEQDKNDKQ